MADVAYIECLAAQEAVYWEARRQGMNLTDRQVGDLLRAAAPYLVKHDLEETLRQAVRIIAPRENRQATREGQDFLIAARRALANG